MGESDIHSSVEERLQATRTEVREFMVAVTEDDDPLTPDEQSWLADKTVEIRTLRLVAEGIPMEPAREYGVPIVDWLPDTVPSETFPGWDKEDDRTRPARRRRLLYLMPSKEIVDIPYLTNEEESDLVNAIDVGKWAKEHLTESWEGESETEPLTSLQEMYKRMWENGEKAKDKLLWHNMRRVLQVASHYKWMIGQSISHEDLFQAGLIGLAAAIDHCEVREDTKFAAFARKYIRGHIVRYLYDNLRTIRIPQSTISDLDAYRAVVAAYKHDHGVLPNDVEAGKLMGKKPRRIKELRFWADQPRVLSLDRITEVTDEDFAAEFEQDPDNIPTLELPSDAEDSFVDTGSVADSRASQEMLADDIDAALNELDERQRTILELRFGLDSVHGTYGQILTLEEIGNFFHLSRERIRAIEAQALAKLKHPLRSAKLRGYLEDD